MSNAIAAHLEAAAKAQAAAVAHEAAIVAARAAAAAHSEAAKTAADASHALGIASGEVLSGAQVALAQAKSFLPYILAVLGGLVAGLAPSVLHLVK